MTIFLQLFLFQERLILLFTNAILPSYFLYVSLMSKAKVWRYTSYHGNERLHLHFQTKTLQKRNRIKSRQLVIMAILISTMYKFSQQPVTSVLMIIVSKSY